MSCDCKKAATSFDFLSNSAYDIFLSSKIRAVSFGCFATTSSNSSTTDLSDAYGCTVLLKLKIAFLSSGEIISICEILRLCLIP